MVLAAGNVTRTMPCTSPAAYTTWLGERLLIGAFLLFAARRDGCRGHRHPPGRGGRSDDLSGGPIPIWLQDPPVGQEFTDHRRHSRRAEQVTPWCVRGLT